MNTNNIDYNELNKLLKDVKDIVDRGKLNVVTVNKQNFVVFENGTIYRNVRGCYKIIENKVNHSGGYNSIDCDGKKCYRHRIIAYEFLNLDINNNKLQVDHLDGCRINNNVNNLRIVNNQQNHMNLRKAKGYCWCK